MRLTNQLREQIINDICSTLLDKEYAALKVRENQLAVQCYNAVFAKKHRDMMNELPRGFFAETSSLRFNIGGMDAKLHTKERTRIPFAPDGSNYEDLYHRSGNRLGNIADESIKQKFLDLHNDTDTLEKKKIKITNDTNAMLNSVQTYAQLEKNWPEGKKFYAKYKPKNNESNLPAIRVAELNKTLGIAV